MEKNTESLDIMADQEIPWPSKRIPQGGLFHQPKIKYSKETSDLLNLLMKESRLSMMFRKKINSHLQNGEPLPFPVIKRPPSHIDENDSKAALQIMSNARVARRKSLADIKASGAYETTKFRPKPDIREYSEKAKIRLQEAMSGLKVPFCEVPERRKPVAKIPKHASEPGYQIDELLEEINERATWLAEMEEIGEGKKYKDLIHGQIAEKLRQIRLLERKIDEIEKYKHEQEFEDAIQRKK